MSSVNIRKVKASIDNLYLEKQKMEKGDKPKKAKTGVKVKARIRVEEDVSLKIALDLVPMIYKFSIIFRTTHEPVHTKRTTLMISCKKNCCRSHIHPSARIKPEKQHENSSLFIYHGLSKQKYKFFVESWTIVKNVWKYMNFRSKINLLRVADSSYWFFTIDSFSEQL